ncbi:ABC transporter permease [Paenirhodobacter populi]|uniref:ABC transporter permease n=1 Tax=Paenirhodobacter populi TaxID=2306993 RepID=A0A443ITI4_9RHOB|nr:ABC transporter permease [Sinirhodobacter populi]RWR06160.1 ABC transporter permease [Sinirhodobacter populi]RWR11016.1 ABC transporter permease [Sinirhodobacter populi]RWR21091.1 ABC transporter permease [Sinirhodobacter populi]RWR32465.1 ABC transporter permease [Sinirhodobacter populi]RWR34943.1 ABC transporter permease [Sinirhodobacter populi]
MFGFVLKRVLSAIPVLLMVAVIVFLVLRLSPGDPAVMIAGPNATPEQLEDLRTSMGLNRPLLEQLFIWMGNIARGDFGVSLVSGKPVADLVMDRFGPTLALSITTVILAVAVAIPLGVIAAWQQGKWIDRLVMAGSVVGFSVPVFIIGYVLILIFARKLGWFPVQGYRPMSAGFGEFASRLVLPTVTLSFPYIALIARIVRTNVIEVMNEDYIRTARAKGLAERGVLMDHALGNAAVPIVTIVGVSITMLIGGVVVTESVFNIPGLGRLVLEAVLARDYTVIQTVILLFSTIYVFINLSVDLLYGLFDPRIRY